MSDLIEPHVGIFWYYEEKLIADTAQVSEVRTVHGFRDAPTSHYEFWEYVRNQYPELAIYEYEDIPRGRVVMQVKGPTYFVYSSELLINNQKFREQLLERFHLPRNKTRFLSDQHYEDPSTIIWD